MSKKKKQKVIFPVIILVILITIIVFSFNIAPDMAATSYKKGMDNVIEAMGDILEPEPVKPEVKHVETPEAVKAIYMTACVAGTPSFRNDLVELIDETELNSVIIDVKDFTGTISFDTEDPEMIGVNGTGCRVSDMQDFVKYLHEKDIYTIARITVFQDPFYTSQHPELAVKKASDGSVWEYYKCISFIEVGAREYWEYVLKLAEITYELGFDEINFDYVRFPSDGNMKDIYFPFSEELITENPSGGKAIALESFFKYVKKSIDEINKELKEEGKQEIITSVDLFGMVTTNTDDLNIGQVLERALPYFDYIAPMVYPSHYPAYFNDWADPNKYPYELIKFVMSSGVQRVRDMINDPETPDSVKDHLSIQQLRPWLQDFDYGGNYDVKEVRDQIQATYDSELDSWMLWAASNRYTRDALEDE
jgi:hypothetical protein